MITFNAKPKSIYIRTYISKIVRKMEVVRMKSDLVKKVGISDEELLELCDYKTLDELSEKYRERMQMLLDAINKIEDILTEVAKKAQIEVESEEIAITERKWRFGSGYTYEYVLTVRNKLIPHDVEKIGSSFYVYGDFNNYEEYADVHDILYLTEYIDVFIEEFRESLNERNEKIEQLLEKIKL